MSDHTTTLVHQLKEDLADQPKNPIRPHQIEDDHAEEFDRMRSMATAPPWVPGNRNAISKRLKQKRANLEAQMAKPITDPAKRDRVHRRSQELLETVIRPAMLPQEVMRRNPAGAVDAYRAREASRPVKDAILTWKRAQIALHADEKDNRGIANLEPFRPSIAPTGMSTFMGDAQIPGHFAMSPQAKANWPLTDPCKSPLAQAKQREQYEQRERSKRVWTPEARRAAGERLQAAKRAKQQSSAE